ncbi:hypothetical protein NB640_04170 [Oxalobacter vibrioformis]|uniref:DUF4145 domain-containing protein n=1 Tax=Oxalobacter vibrioformis TaxID=933080 RepID=A0A9E9LXU0_9BURK|nr:hypothetical protein [Oxalobacter vibrioformis]WAW10849.1 hypothetical protein NB640_04170 [Oxalobacter vibrioformis]
MEQAQAISLLRRILSEIRLPSGAVAFEKFIGLRDVDSKVRDVRHIIESVDGLPKNFVIRFDEDHNFQENSRRVRLEALVGHIRSALTFLEANETIKPKKIITSPPDVSKLTSTLPLLNDVITRRWREAQKCVHVECYTAAVIMMGSILEALLLARAQLDPATAHKSSKAQKDTKTGKDIALQNWSLNVLIEVAVDVGWLKSDRAKFGHALRESRNVVHPWVEITSNANFDNATCRTSWEVLKASVNDLLKSI